MAAADGGGALQALPEWARGIALKTGAGAGLGAVAGASLAALRGHPVPFYTVSVAANMAIVSTAFFGAETALRAARGGEDHWSNWAGAGALSGGVLSGAFAGKARAPYGAVFFAALGGVGFFVAGWAEERRAGVGEAWRARRAAEARSSERSSGRAQPAPQATPQREDTLEKLEVNVRGWFRADDEYIEKEVQRRVEERVRASGGQ